MASGKSSAEEASVMSLDSETRNVRAGTRWMSSRKRAKPGVPCQSKPVCWRIRVSHTFSGRGRLVQGRGT